MDSRTSIQSLAAMTLLAFSLLTIPTAAAQQADVAEAADIFVDNWLDAWQSQDTEAYFNYYHQDFRSRRFPDLDNWRNNRIRNITRPSRIVLERETIELLSSTENSLTIRFNLLFRAPDYADNTRKELVLAISGGQVTGILEENNIRVEALPAQLLIIPQSDTPAQDTSVPVQQPQGVQPRQQPPLTADAEAIGEVEAEAAVPNEAESFETTEAAVTETAPQNTPETLIAPGIETIQETAPEPSGNSVGAAQEVTEPETEQVPEAVTDVLQADEAQEASPPVAPSFTSAEDWVPPGFENLNQPQVTEIDVYYGGYFLTSVLAEFTNEQVTVLDIPGLAQQLSGLRSPEAFQAYLNSPLDAHNELLCFSEFQSDCGSLETDSVEVIFDRDLLRMWLFVSPDLLVEAGSNVVRFLPPSEAGLSFMNQTALYFTTEELNLDTYNLFNNTLFAWGENRVSMRSNLVSGEGFDIDTMAFFREYRGRDYHLGLIRENANNFSFMSNERLAGASYASSLLTRSDLEQSLGNEIELYFATRSRVEIYREGRLISSSFYNVGNHLLDTSDLPNGSYTIEIRIIDAAGNRTVEERFYSKTGNIPPQDQPLFFIHTGILKNDLDSNRLSRTGDDEFIIRGGFSKRLGHTIGGNIGFSLVEDTSFLELGLFKQGQSYEVQANAAYENTGASGLDLRMRYRHPQYNITLNGRQVFNGQEESQIGLDYQQYNAMLEIPARSGFYSFFHRSVARPDIGKTLNTGFRFRSHLQELFGGTFSNNFELSKNGDEVLALWNFSWSVSEDNHFSNYSPTLTYANADSSRDSGLYGTYETNWYRGDPGASEYLYSLRGNYDSQSSLEARMEANTGRGSADITGRYNEANRKVELSGRLSSSFATTGKATAIGGKRRSESAFLVRVEGDVDAEARFDVVVNGAVRGQLGADQTLLVTVSPYNTYDVELRSVGATLVAVDNRVYRETMYPGNVVNLSWSSQVINIAIGRLVDEQGNALANAVIQNVVGIALADENGIFQAEINQDTEELVVIRGNERCIARFSNPRTAATILSLGTLVCR